MSDAAARPASGGWLWNMFAPTVPARRDPAPTIQSASTFLDRDILVRLAENGCAREVVRCVNLCRDTRSNAQLWAKVVDLPLPSLWTGGLGTRLITWARDGDLARVRATLDRGANVDARNRDGGHTALMAACGGNHGDVVWELLARGADVHARTRTGETAMLDAAAFAAPAVVLELAARGADVNARDARGRTPLLRAARFDRVAVAAELLRLGADVNVQDDGGETPLIVAIVYHNAATARALLAADGIDVNVADAAGRTALSHARGDDATIALLVAAGAVR